MPGIYQYAEFEPRNIKIVARAAKLAFDRVMARDGLVMKGKITRRWKEHPKGRLLVFEADLIDPPRSTAA